MRSYVMDRPLWLPWRRRSQWLKLLIAAGAVGLLCGSVTVVFAQDLTQRKIQTPAQRVDLAQDLTKTEIHTRALRGNLQVLLGYGGTMAVSSRTDGNFLVPDE